MWLEMLRTGKSKLNKVLIQRWQFGKVADESKKEIILLF
jgi:hypothetical protein